MVSIIRRAQLETDAITLEIPARAPSHEKAEADVLAVTLMDVSTEGSQEIPSPDFGDSQKAAATQDDDIQTDHVKRNSQIDEAMDEEPNIALSENQIVIGRLTAELAELKQCLDDKDELLKELQDELSLAVTEIKAQAFREGSKNGFDEGVRQGQESINHQVRSLENAAQHFVESGAQALEMAEDKLVDLVFRSVCKIIGETLSDRDSVSKVVANGLRNFRNANKVVIHLNPQDFDYVNKVPKEYFAGSIGSIEFVPDDSVSIEGCVFETDIGTLDCRLEKQLEHFKELLLSVRHSRD